MPGHAGSQRRSRAAKAAECLGDLEDHGRGDMAGSPNAVLTRAILKCGVVRSYQEAPESPKGAQPVDVQTEKIEVPASGGMTCFLARPKDTARAPAVLVIQEAFGVNGHIKDVTRRVAAEGYVALAPDLYWRAGKQRTVPYDQIGEAIALMQGVSDQDIVADVGNAIAYLERQPFVRADRIGITGFCMGGRVAYLAACE